MRNKKGDWFSVTKSFMPTQSSDRLFQYTSMSPYIEHCNAVIENAIAVEIIFGLKIQSRKTLVASN